MRYYDLDVNGKVKGSYAIPQPGKALHLLDEAPNDESMRDGVPGSKWMPDPVIVSAKQIEAAAVKAQVDAKAGMSNLPGWASWNAAEATSWINTNVTDLASAKNALEKIAEAIIYLRDYARIVK